MSKEYSADDLEKALVAVDELLEKQEQTQAATRELRAAIKSKLPNIHNPNCCGAHCRFSRGEVRILPIAPGTLTLCRDCYEQEIRWRKEANRLSTVHRYSLPTWQSLRIYD